jgi:hypothetical protein
LRAFFSSEDRKSRACIAHKSSEIFERCRLWQQNSPATPDYSTAFFGEKNLKEFVSIHLC